MSLRDWFRPPRHWLGVFLVITLALSTLLVWFGWRSIQQDRVLALQALKERREQAAALIVSALEQRVAAAEQSLRDPYGIFAEFEREILRDRVRAGLAHARQNGKRLGRPLTAGLQAVAIRKLHGANIAKAEIARRLQVGRTSVRRILGEKNRT